MILPTGRKPSRDGQTLIEVLIAVVILSTGIVLILGAFDSCVTGLGSARDIILGYFLLEQVLSEQEAAGVHYNPGTHAVGGMVPHKLNVSYAPVASSAGAGYSRITVRAFFDNAAPCELTTYCFVGDN